MEELIYIVLFSIIYFIFVFGITIFKLGASLNKTLLDDVPRGTQTPLLAIAMMAIILPSSKACEDAKARNKNLFLYRVLWLLIPIIMILNIVYIWNLPNT